YYEVRHDGSLKLNNETYVMGGRCRWILSPGNQCTMENGLLTILHPEGVVTIESSPKRMLPFRAMSAKEILTINTARRGAKVSVKRGATWQNRRVDQYTVEGDIVDG